MKTFNMRENSSALSDELYMPPGPHAADITLKETLELLDGPFGPVAAGVSQDLYALWLGSGISFGRVEGLRKLVPRVLAFLQQRVGAGNPNCRFRKALDEALALAAVTAPERALIDLERPIIEWPSLDAIVNRLVNNYARFLEIGVDGEEDDYLLWEGVNVTDTYADPTVEPDVEHLCIAILVLEGVASEIASANWDGLIEKAVDELAGGRPAIVACVHPDDLRQPDLQAHLYKFHGCAVRAGEDGPKYRPLLIARQSQINGWTARAENAALLTRLIDIAITKPTLMMGLSAQDANIQGIFAAAENRMAWPWPSAPPAYVFSEDQLGIDQWGLLKNVYHAAYTAATREQIYDSALVRAFARSLLGSLVLYVVSTKLAELIDLAPGNLQPADRAIIYSGVVHLRDAVATAGPPKDAAFVRRAVARIARIMALFQDGNATGLPLAYRAVTSRPIQHLKGDPGLAATGLREFAIAVGLLGLGAKFGTWTVEPVDPSDLRAGAMRVTGASGPTKLFLAATANSAMHLEVNGHLGRDEDAILIHSLNIDPPAARSPTRAIGRLGYPGLREVSISSLLAEAANGDELFQRFREELTI